MNDFDCLPDMFHGKSEELTNEMFRDMFKKKNVPQGLILLPSLGAYDMYQYPAEIVKGIITLSNIECKKDKMLLNIKNIVDGKGDIVTKIAKIKDVLSRALF
jgi:hypothetical protein